MMIVNIYLLATTCIFTYTLVDQSQKSNNYFAAILRYSSNPLNIFILYNMIVTIAITIYKIIVAIFFESSNEGETLKIIDKFKSKIFDVILFCYIIELQFNFQVYMAIVLLITLFTIHTHIVLRTQFLIHVQTTNNSLRLHYKTLGLFFVLIFVDYSILKFNGMNIFAIQNEREAMFLYYLISIVFSITEPFLTFMIQFYQKYTFGHFKNSDQFLLNASLVINIPRNIILILLSLCIALKFSQPFFIILCCFDNLGQLKDSIQSYYKCRNLTKSMQFLKTVEKDDLKEYHDLTCTVCYEQIQQGKLLPCGHIFHEECIRQWIIKNHNHFCPKCKRQFNFDNLEQQYKNQTIKKTKTKQQSLNGFRSYFKAKYDEQAEEKNQNNSEESKRSQKEFSEEEKQEKKQQKLTNKRLRSIYEKERERGQYDSEEEQREYPLLVDQLIKQSQTYERKQKDSIKYKPMKKGNVRHYIVNQPQIGDLPLEFYERKKKKIIPLGSLPFSMPTMAVANRTAHHIDKRKQYIKQIQVILRLMEMSKTEQLLLI